MERDFMGLFVKQEAPDEITDAAPVRSLTMQWSFSNKGSALPQLLSFQGTAQEDKPKTGFDSLTSSGLVSLTKNAFDSDHKPFSAAPKSMIPESQGEVRYTVTTYPTQHVDTYTISHQSVSPAVTPFIHQFFLAPRAGVPMVNPVQATPGSSPVVGTTDLRKSAKISNAPAQLTIFYNGSVCVYDNISPEKAQAIMLLAGNGPPMATPPAVPSMPRSAICQARSSPVHVTPISVSQSAGRTGIKTETNAAWPSGVVVSTPIIAEPLKSVHPLRSATFLSSGTVPQFRRKSLARFLEKRKERVIAAECQSPDCSVPGAGETNLPMNSSGSCPVPAAN